MRGTGRSAARCNGWALGRLVYRKPIALQLRSGTGQSSSRSMLAKGSIFLNEIFLVLRHIVDGMDRVGGASRNTGATVDTTLGIHLHLSGGFETGFVLLGLDAIGGADLDAKGILDAGISDYIGHDESISKRK